MAKPEWGQKRKCLKCGTFFYDMNKTSFSCPKCHEEYTLETYEENKTKQLMKLAKKVAPKIEDEELDEETLLQMTEDIPLADEGMDPDDELEILEDEPDMEGAERSELDGIVDHFSDEEGNER